MFLSKYDCLELPEFNPDRPLLVDKTSFKDASAAAISSGETTFIRHVRHFGHNNQSVRNRIEIAEAEFTRLESYCGAYVVRHEFGLYPIERQSHTDLQSTMIPLGYILAAEVELVYDVQEICLSSPSLTKISYDLNRYEKTGQNRLSDVHIFDFLNARIQPDAKSPRQLVFTDIEPMII